MTSISTSGISRTRFGFRETSLLWRLENFSTCNKKFIESIECQIFPKLMEDICEWKLCVYPQGHHNASNDDITSVYLRFISGAQKTTTVKLNLSYANTEGTIIKSLDDASYDCNQNNHFILLLSIKRNELIPNLKDDVLVINCSLRWYTYINNNFHREIVSEIDVHKNLSNDLSQLMIKGSFNDVTLLSEDGKEFPAHKFMLAARSPVFAAMFEHNMKERQESTVKIEDFSSDILKTMLEFIYTSRFDRDKCEIEELLVAADKYDIKDLKVSCEEELSKRISIENAADLLLLADQRNSKLLKKQALDFITIHLKAVRETPGMRNLLSVQPSLCRDIFNAI